MATTGAPGDTGRQNGLGTPAAGVPAADRQGAPQRAQAPIRWPHPNGPSLTLVGVWAVGVVVALGVPALIVSPNQTRAATGRVALAFATTVVGALVMLIASLGLWRRTRDSSVIIMGAVPAAACVAGGIILATTKLTG